MDLIFLMCSMMMFNAFAQQAPVITMTINTTRSQPFDPLAEIRNGKFN